MMFLFDTNIISELFRRQPNLGVVAFSQQVKRIYLSVISIEEIAFGLSAKPIPQLSKRFESFVAAQCIVLPISADIARQCGEMRGQLRTRGISRTQADMLIAATAKCHQLTLVTRNVRDFELCDISIVNPFT